MHKKIKYNKLRDYPMNTENPFKEGVINVVNEAKGIRKIFATGKNADAILDGETGELKGHAVFAKRYEIDKTKFAKLYISEMSSFMDLTKTGLRVLFYVLAKMPQDRDFILFDIEEAMKITGYKTEKSVFTGIGELLECRFLARSNKTYLYYINPQIAFNGNRMTLVRDYTITNPTDRIDLSKEARAIIEEDTKLF